MKIRVPAIKLYINIFKLLGADPSSMNFGELFTALAQGTMDGQENPAAVIYSSRMYEVQKYLTIWNYSYDPIVLCMNRKTWNSLPPDIRGVFARCARDAMEYEYSLVAEGERAAVDSLRAKGMEVNSLDPKAAASFRALAEPIYRTYAREIGGNLIERLRVFSRGDSMI
jgi:TRAP-type C4-dicarboxylate transport system substrate-binding protein